MKVIDILGASARKGIQQQPSPIFCIPDCRIGLEYEWERCKLFYVQTETASLNHVDPPKHIEPVLNLFDSHVDGSLRKDGTEFTFKEGYEGTKILAAIDAMDECARIMKFEGSYRTSLHCHLDMQNTKFPEDVFSFGAIYCLVEPFLYNFVGQDREHSNYCVPWYNHTDHIEEYFKTLKAPNVSLTDPKKLPHLSSYFKSKKIHKYSGLNFFSLGDFGTVEFRQAPVTMQKAKIIQWINLIMRLKKWVLEHPNITGEGLIHRAHRVGPEAILKEVFEEDYREAVKMTKDIHAAFKIGMSTLYSYVAISQ